jgi:hypothetical protein
MAELRHLIPQSQVDDLWSRKDEIGLLDKDPMRLYKGKFVDYLELLADKSFKDYSDAGLDADEAMAKVRADLTELTAEWKIEAARRSTDRARSRGNV